MAALIILIILGILIAMAANRIGSGGTGKSRTCDDHFDSENDYNQNELDFHDDWDSGL
ncbi:MAG: hypothetical protein ABIA63_13400 [bacterium]